MPRDDGDDSPQDFAECVSQEQLQLTVTKVVTNALVGLKLSNTLESLDKQLSTLTDRVAALEAQPPHDEDIDGSNANDEVYGADGNVDKSATRQNRLSHRLRTTSQVWVALNTSTTIEVIVLMFLMILMLRLNLPYLLFRDIMMLKNTLIGRR
jgi:hypothetical protein